VKYSRQKRRKHISGSSAAWQMRAKARWPSSNLLIVLALVSHGQRELHQTKLGPGFCRGAALQRRLPGRSDRAR
jgi:hypothetical protein